MPLSDETLRLEIRELVSTADRRYFAISNNVTAVAAILAPVAGIGVVWGMAATVSANWWALGGVGLSVLAVTFFVPFMLQDTYERRNFCRAAAQIRNRYSRENGDYDRAIELLKKSRSDSEVEDQILTALGLDVTFADQTNEGLLGDFENKATTDVMPVPVDVRRQSDAGDAGLAPNRPDFIPLDPYAPVNKPTGQ